MINLELPVIINTVLHDFLWLSESCHFGYCCDCCVSSPVAIAMSFKPGLRLMFSFVMNNLELYGES